MKIISLSRLGATISRLPDTSIRAIYKVENNTIVPRVKIPTIPDRR